MGPTVQLIDFSAENFEETLKLEVDIQSMSTFVEHGQRGEEGVPTNLAKWNVRFSSPQEALEDYATQRLQGSTSYQVFLETVEGGMDEVTLRTALSNCGVSVSGVTCEDD